MSNDSSPAVRLFFVLASSFLIASAARSNDFQVNTYTTGTQSLSDIAMQPSGSFVVVWQSTGSVGNDNDFSSIQGQRYDAGGNALGGQFQVNTTTAGDQRGAAVATNPNGDFVVVWQSESSPDDDTDGHSIQGRRFAANGTPLGDQFQVNNHTPTDQLAPDVAVADNGNFVTVWFGYSSTDNDDHLQSIQSRIFEADGTPISHEFQVNIHTTSSQTFPSVAAAGNGEFVVVWQSVGGFGGDTSMYSVQGLRFNANGISLDAQFQVNQHTTSFQGAPRVAADHDGNFTVVWHGYNDLEADTGVVYRRYHANGAELTDEMPVATYTELSQTDAAIAMDAAGEAVIVWHSQGSPGTDHSNTSVQARRLTAQGAVLFDQFQINTFTPSNQFFPAVALSPAGSFVVTWTSQGSEGSDNDAQSVQRSGVVDLLFGDNFESGTTERWTGTQ